MNDITPLQVKKLKSGEEKLLRQDNIARMWQNQALRANLFKREAHNFSY